MESEDKSNAVRLDKELEAIHKILEVLGAAPASAETLLHSWTTEQRMRVLDYVRARLVRAPVEAYARAGQNLGNMGAVLGKGLSQ